MIVNGTDLFTGLLVLLLLLSAGLAVSLVIVRSLTIRNQLREADLTDGAVVIVAQGKIVEAGETALALLGQVIGQPAEAALRARFADPEIGAALARLERSGQPMRMLVRDLAGRPFELIGGPRGGQLRLVLREASFLEAELARAEALAAERERALAAEQTERDAIRALLAEAPILAWSRQGSGGADWSAGRLPTRLGSIEPKDAVEILAARARGGRQTAAEGGIERARVEVMPPGGGEPLPLQVIELPQPGGRRIGFAVDATVAASAERTLTRFVQTMTEIFAHLTVGLAIFDRNQTLALFNPALVQLWQIDPAWLAQRPSLREILDQLRGSRRIPEAADYHKFRAGMLKLFDNPETVDYETIWHLDDGTNIRVLARPHPHGSLAFIFDDVTERVRLEQRYRHMVDLRRATLNRLDEGLAVFGPDGLLQFVNQAFHDIWDIGPESLEGQIHAREVLPLCQALTVELEPWRELIASITSSEGRRAWHARLTMGSGRKLSLRVAPLPDGATMVVFSDITDSERIAIALSERNEALEAAEEMRSAVLDQISHQLRTPLNTIFGFGQLLADPRFGTLTERQSEYASGILEAAGHLLDTIDDVTELASMQIDQAADQASDLILDDALILTQRLLEKRAVEAGVAVIVTPSGVHESLKCDVVRMRQVIFNLAAAALGRTGPGGRVELSAMGVPPSGIEIATTEIATGAPTRPGQPAGLHGLTLGLIRRLVAREGGTVEVEEGGPGFTRRIVCRFPGIRVMEAEGGAPDAASLRTGRAVVARPIA